LKDLNDELSFIEGTWKGVINNKQYVFEFTIFHQVLKAYENDLYEYKDELKGKFQVVDLITNQILYDNLNTTNYDDYKNLEFDFGFYDSDNCFNRVYFKLFKNNLTQVIYKDFELGGFGDLLDCPAYENKTDIPMFLPIEDFILTKK
jgi:hypothetical protein